MTDTSSEISLLPQAPEVALDVNPAEELEQQPVLKPVVRAIQRLEDVIDTETRLCLKVDIQTLLTSTRAKAAVFMISTRQSKGCKPC